MKTVLTIAGSDSCGGAGIQADLKTFAALGVYGLSAVTAITAQNTTGVRAVQEISPGMLAEQIDCLFADIAIDAVKIGMVASADAVRVIAQRLIKWDARNIVLDPVIFSSSGSRLMHPDAWHILVKDLLPLAAVVTPNLLEAEALTGHAVATVSAMEAAAITIKGLGPRGVVIKGGHLEGDPVDVFYDGGELVHLPERRVAARNTHGTGCTFSSAVTACLAQGHTPLEAVRRAKEYVFRAIAGSGNMDIGRGPGPLQHFFGLDVGDEL